MILPGSSSSSRVKPGGKSLSEKYILFAILFVLIFGTVTMVVLLPRGDDLERIPEVRVREEERVVGAEREERLKKEEDRLEGLINRISQREEKLEKILQRLNDKEEKMDKEPPHRNQYVGDEEVEKKNHGRDVPLDLPQNNIHHDNNFNPKQLKLTEDSQRLAAVRNAMEHAWGNYKKYAWGFDELQPLSRSGDVTFAWIKPDAVEGGNLAEILSKITEKFQVVYYDVAWMTERHVEMFYQEHIGRSFWPKLVDLMTKGPGVAMILRSKEPVEKNDKKFCPVGDEVCVEEDEKGYSFSKWRKYIGPTNSEEARKKAPGSLRALFGKDGTSNAFHGSDSLSSVIREIELVFFHPLFRDLGRSNL